MSASQIFRDSGGNPVSVTLRLQRVWATSFAESAEKPALESQARTGSARRATCEVCRAEPGVDEPGHDWRLMAGSTSASR
jgi:hypothetical protein